MIHVASRSTNGVKIPDRKVTRAEIIEMFKKQMKYLRTRLNASFFLVQMILPLNLNLE
jgi:hypothetical protein